jgi:hypothetical protein
MIADVNDINRVFFGHKGAPKNVFREISGMNLLQALTALKKGAEIASVPLVPLSAVNTACPCALNSA